jgi:CTP:molybdopterin cytidylyltransferase MocA
MPWKPGQSGNPEGRPKAREIRDAFRMELAAAELGDMPELKPDTLRALARAQIKKAMDGDSAAFNIVADRVEGKPIQPVVGDDEYDPIRMIHRIERVIVDVDHRDGSPVPPPPEAEPL